MRCSRSELNLPDRNNATTRSAMPITSRAVDTFNVGESTKRKVRYDQIRLNMLKPSCQRMVVAENLAVISDNGLNSANSNIQAVANAAIGANCFKLSGQLY